MAAITPGSGGTLKASTVEGQIGELSALLNQWQTDAAKNPTGLNYITVSAPSSLRAIAIGYSFPVQAIAAVGGGFTYEAQEYLTTPGFSAGSGGTITDNTTLGYFYRLIQHAQELESPLQTGTNAIDRIGGSLNINSKLFTGTTTLLCTPSLDASTGAIVLTPDEYL